MRLTDTIAARLLARVPGEADVGAWHRGDATVVGVGVEEVVVGDGAAALARLDDLGPGTWVGWLAFELGHAIETVVCRGAGREPPAVRDVVFARFGAHAVITPDGSISVEGDGAGHAVLHAARRRVGSSPREAPPLDTCPTALEWASSLDRDAFEARVDAIVELLLAGECYQVNLTRRLTSPTVVDPLALYRRLACSHPAPHLALLRLRDARVGHVAVVSASPERFLRVDGRRVETQPIKGTAPDAHSLRGSAKDHAENVMIVDLARNDLGRVCEPGTIHVPSLFAVEAHPGLHHLVSTVCGTLRDDVGMGALVAAAFPPASVTGAPKPRVLQAIDDLEPVRRGVYCGGIGWIDTERRCADLAVAIRTFCVFDDRTELGVGAGIVADSSPTAEWEETALKASRLLAVASATSEGVPARPVGTLAAAR
ncbi:MAG: anthranilate synthase component I family protein [Acidimicrobiia bacterium]